MISCFFGLPGCGKTSILSKIAHKELKKISKGKSQYQDIYCNFPLHGTKLISTLDLSTYYFHDSLILLDEITLDCDSRDFKKFDKNLKEFILLHRHVHCDIIYATQAWDRVDKTIRDCTFNLFYVKKSFLPFFNRFSRAVQIYRNININEFTSELVVGYRFGKLLEMLFNPSVTCYRPFYYKYFDSFDDYSLSARPDADFETVVFSNLVNNDDDEDINFC